MNADLGAVLIISAIMTSKKEVRVNTNADLMTTVYIPAAAVRGTA